MKKIKTLLAALTLVATMSPFAAQAAMVSYEAPKATSLSPLNGYDSGLMDEDGGVQEIVDYNEDNMKLYSVNGKTGVIDVVALADMEKTQDEAKTLTADSIDVIAGLKEFAKGTEFEGFVYGDMTSISVNEQLNVIAVALQAEGLNDDGLVVFMDYEGNIKKLVWAGKQPDMLTFDEKGGLLLVANEGEPRDGYGEGTVDPKGSVTVIRLKGGLKKVSAKDVSFDAFDAKIAELAADGVVLKKDSKPSVDLEPEYITIDQTSHYAYVSLQEANAIGVLNLKSMKFEGVYGLGFQNHNLPGKELDLFKDKEINIKNEDVYGIRMPDGIDSYRYKGDTYVVTANEGDAREWGDYINEIEDEETETIYFDKSDYLGLDQSKTYIFGGRSFSIFKVDKTGLTCVYDSGSDFEKITAEVLPDMFNTSNDKIKLDNRSGKKGPEPESVVVGKEKGRTYAFVALERIGGLMTYDVTNPYNVKFQSYINTRDFSEKVAGDVAPEGLVYIPKAKSPTKKSLLAAAYEVSGTIGVYEFTGAKKGNGPRK